MDYERDIYLMMEINFLKENNRNVKEDNSDLFPANWYLCTNYVLMTEILMEAIKKKIRIIDTTLYQEKMIEGVM